MAAWIEFDAENPPFRPEELVDIVAKKWEYKTDRFVLKRFAEAHYTRTVIITGQNPNPGVQWNGVLDGYRPIYYMPIPELPEIN